MVYGVDCKRALIQVFFDLVREVKQESVDSQLKKSMRTLATCIIVNYPKLGSVDGFLAQVEQLETTFMDVFDTYLSVRHRSDRYEILKRLIEVKTIM